MNTFNTNAHSIRSKQKYFSMLSCLIFGLLIVHASSQRAKEDDAAALDDSDYTDADDIEWGNFPIAEATTKGHPVIFYKEDIVSEDYDPNKDNKSAASSSKEAKPQFRRKYKDINRRNRLNRTENYRYIKPEKVYFDVYPIEYDKTNEDDSKFNDDDIQVEVISLLDDPNQEDGAYSKHQLNKRPKKVVRHHRQRRDVSTQDLAPNRRSKRDPFIHLRYYLPAWFATKKTVAFKGIYINIPDPNVGIRQTTPRPTPTTKSTPIMPDIKNRIGEEDDNANWRVWGMEPVTDMQPRRRRPLPPIIHAGDEDYIHSTQANKQPELAEIAPIATTTSRPRTTTPRPRPTTTRVRTTYRPTFRTTTAAPTQPPSLKENWQQLAPQLEAAPVGIEPCIWAVSTCCRSQTEIQYSCFEYLGCIGSFWDVNPCSEQFVKDAVETVNNYFRAK